MRRYCGVPWSPEMIRDISDYYYFSVSTILSWRGQFFKHLHLYTAFSVRLDIYSPNFMIFDVPTY